MELNSISGAIIEAAMEVHTMLGPGLLESTYESRLKHELALRNLFVLSQVTLPVTYKDKIIVELKTVDRFLPILETQLLSYLKMSNKKIGLLINFNVTRLKLGIKRIIN